MALSSKARGDAMRFSRASRLRELQPANRSTKASGSIAGTGDVEKSARFLVTITSAATASATAICMASSRSCVCWLDRAPSLPSGMSRITFVSRNTRIDYFTCLATMCSSLASPAFAGTGNCPVHRCAKSRANWAETQGVAGRFKAILTTSLSTS
jgi:hypothetical protein